MQGLNEAEEDFFFALALKWVFIYVALIPFHIVLRFEVSRGIRISGIGLNLSTGLKDKSKMLD